MSETRLQKARELNQELNCKYHFWVYMGQSDIAPFIEPNGDRTTIKVCFNCGLRLKTTRTQIEFLAEIESYLP